LKRSMTDCSEGGSGPRGAICRGATAELRWTNALLHQPTRTPVNRIEAIRVPFLIFFSDRGAYQSCGRKNKFHHQDTKITKFHQEIKSYSLVFLGDLLGIAVGDTRDEKIPGALVVMHLLFGLRLLPR
jgi:hypothetical protein